ncbi:MAG: amidohydrolase family protein [Bacteroidota bacterium]|nr:amidohydrolase family protein [Bacteroidota bacterium]
MAAAADKRVFDAHFHVGAFGAQRIAGRVVRPIAPQREQPGACSEYLDRYGLAGGLIVPTYLDDETAAFRYNRLLMQELAGDDRLIGGLWVSPLEHLWKLCEAALKILPHPRIRALKIASNTWPRRYSIDPDTWDQKVRWRMERILDVAEQHHLVIHCHTGYLPGAEPLAFDSFLQEFGHRARFQLVHMGETIAPVFAFVPRFVDWVQCGLRVYTDTSIVPGFGPPWLLEELDRYNLGYDRVLFATDTPWGRYPSERAKLDIPGLPGEVLDAMLWSNAANLYRLEAPSQE